MALVSAFCVGLIGLTLLGQSATVLPASAAAAPPSGPRLRTLAGSFLVGYASANDFWSMGDTSQYEATASSEYNVLTPENQLKWVYVHPQQNSYNFAPGDQHIQFAVANGMRAHGHTLVWHYQNPSWLTNGTWTASSLTAVLYDHIDTVVGHYKGQIAMWDVVNEALNDDGSLRSTIWSSNIGPQYIELAFQRAHAADPLAVLIYNDYGIEPTNSKSNSLYNMASDFVRRGVPINAIGMQMHLDAGGVDLNSLAANMQRFASLGLSIYITEMDVRIPASPSQNDLNTQATIYQNVLDVCLKQPACKGLQTWGFTDKYSWVPGYFSGMGAALPFDANYQPKPAYYSLQSRLAGGSPPAPTSTSTPVPATSTPPSTPVPPTSTPTPDPPTPTPTSTPVPNTSTPTAVPSTSTPTATRTLTPTATATPKPTNTSVPTPTSTSITGILPLPGVGVPLPH